MDVQELTFSIYTENNIGLLSRVSNIFLKRHINIESLTCSESEIEGVNRFVIVAYTTPEAAQKIVGQLEKQIEVIRAFFHTPDEIFAQESALYKLNSELLFENPHIHVIIQNNHARLLTVARDYFVIEKTGSREETKKLYNELSGYGLLQFVRSGQISVSKSPMKVSEKLVNNTKIHNNA